MTTIVTRKEKVSKSGKVTYIYMLDGVKERTSTHKYDFCTVIPKEQQKGIYRTVNFGNLNTCTNTQRQYEGYYNLEIVQITDEE